MTTKRAEHLCVTSAVNQNHSSQQGDASYLSLAQRAQPLAADALTWVQTCQFDAGRLTSDGGLAWVRQANAELGRCAARRWRRVIAGNAASETRGDFCGLRVVAP